MLHCDGRWVYVCPYTVVYMGMAWDCLHGIYGTDLRVMAWKHETGWSDFNNLNDFR